MDSPEFLSQKKYATHCGCDVVIVDRAIKAGKIPAEAITILPNKYKNINVAMADAAWGEEYRATRRRGNKRSRVVEEKQIKAPDTALPPSQPFPVAVVQLPVLGPNTSYNDADRFKKIAEAQLLQLKLEEERGSLVKIDIIEKSFFDHARAVRDSFLSLSDRIIDQIFSAQTRNEANILLQNEIANVLESLSNVPEYRHE